MKRAELLSSREYWMSQIQNDLYEVIEEYMKEHQLTRTGLANQFNFSKGYITQLLNGDFDHKISKLVDLALAVGKVPVVHFVELERYIEDDLQGKRHIYQNGFNPVQYNTYIMQPNAAVSSNFQYKNDLVKDIPAERFSI